MALRPVWSDGPLGEETRKPAGGNVHFHSWHLPRGSELASGKRRQTGSCRRNLRRGWKFWCWSHELYRPHPQLRPDTRQGGENTEKWDQVGRRKHREVGEWRGCDAAAGTPPGPLPLSAGCLCVLLSQHLVAGDMPWKCPSTSFGVWKVFVSQPALPLNSCMGFSDGGLPAFS